MHVCSVQPTHVCELCTFVLYNQPTSVGYVHIAVIHHADTMFFPTPFRRRYEKLDKFGKISEMSRGKCRNNHREQELQDGSNHVRYLLHKSCS